MFGIDMLFKAIGLDDAAIAELRAMLDPARIRAVLTSARGEFDAIKLQLDRIEARIDQLASRTALAEIVAHGGQVMHPNFQEHMDRSLMDAAERGEVAYTVWPALQETGENDGCNSGTILPGATGTNGSDHASGS